MPRTYSTGEFAKELGVHIQTVKKWCREGEIDYVRTPGGKRRIPHRELLRLSGSEKPRDKVAVYGRVSSHGQKKNGDLKRQIERLKEYAHSHGWSVENVYTDIGSGLNEDRRSLGQLMKDSQRDSFGRILITYEDRLTRFGYKFLQKYFEQNGVMVESVEDEVDKSAEEELVEDMIKLVASFSGKLYGMRSSKKRRIVEGVKEEVKKNE
ncbi:resolvase [candidate division MSBL1 archaeon SCGC-AAA259E17]|uniref:Resolvase n=1 Tax=candidate division MSBL1 archaeon SCGC-AAA259E17 TaxID=1698263 RepID=A0A133UG80_9EURY|nr:resolvase [candidate division MSBL1 archaeon SCGC-AAA259E17]